MNNITKYFKVQELVCPHVYSRFGDTAIQFFDKGILDTLLFIREHIGMPIYINNWMWGGNKSQRGLRCNVCALVKEKTSLEKPYLSAHLLGRGIDFNVKGMSAEEVRNWLEDMKNGLPCKIRVEDEVSWVHIDTSSYGMGSNKITYFKG